MALKSLGFCHNNRLDGGLGHQRKVKSNAEARSASLPAALENSSATTRPRAPEEPVLSFSFLFFRLPSSFHKRWIITDEGGKSSLITHRDSVIIPPLWEQ